MSDAGSLLSPSRPDFGCSWPEAAAVLAVDACRRVSSRTLCVGRLRGPFCFSFRPNAFFNARNALSTFVIGFRLGMLFLVPADAFPLTAGSSEFGEVVGIFLVGTSVT